MDVVRLASLPQLRALGLRALADVAPHASALSVPAGRRLLLAGPLHQELVLVAAGRGRVRCAGEVVAELGAGDVFGTLAPALTVYPTATVTADGALELVLFSTRDLRRLRAAAPAAAAALLHACAAAPAAPAAPAAQPAAPARLALVRAAAA